MRKRTLKRLSILLITILLLGSTDSLAAEPVSADVAVQSAADTETEQSDLPSLDISNDDNLNSQTDNETTNESDKASDEDTSTDSGDTVGDIDPAPTEDPSADSIIVPAWEPGQEIVSIILPILEDQDVFNFFIDPKNILYNSFKDSESVTVEEDSHLLFINRSEDSYGLSSHSDQLSIINQSTVPVKVTLTATVDTAEGINLVETDDFTDSTDCDINLLLTDSKGNKIPFAIGEEITLDLILEKAPLDAYAYIYDEETGEYTYSYESGEVEFDSYSFGLVGACNPEADWSLATERPKVSIFWNVEPIMPEITEEEETSTEELTEEETVNDEVTEDKLNDTADVNDTPVINESPSGEEVTSEEDIPSTEESPQTESTTEESTSVEIEPAPEPILREVIGENTELTNNNNTESEPPLEQEIIIRDTDKGEIDY